LPPLLRSDAVLTKRYGNASKQLVFLKHLQTHFKAKHEKGVGTPFPVVPAAVGRTTQNELTTSIFRFGLDSIMSIARSCLQMTYFD